MKFSVKLILLLLLSTFILNACILAPRGRGGRRGGHRPHARRVHRGRRFSAVFEQVKSPTQELASIDHDPKYQQVS